MKYLLTFILIVSFNENFSQGKKDAINLKNLGWHGIYTNYNIIFGLTILYKDNIIFGLISLLVSLRNLK